MKSYIHIRDVSRGELAVMQEGRSASATTSRPTTALRCATSCGDLRPLGRNFEDAVEIVAERPGQDAAYVIDSTKARQ